VMRADLQSVSSSWPQAKHLQFERPPHLDDLIEDNEGVADVHKLAGVECGAEDLQGTWHASH
jgi:hypothetical protein